MVALTGRNDLAYAQDEKLRMEIRSLQESGD